MRTITEQEVFDNWFMQGGQEIATRIYGEQAEKNIAPRLAELPKFTPEDNTFESNNLEGISNNIFWNEVERLAQENKLHKTK
jgi:streptomycin 6-kinase